MSDQPFTKSLTKPLAKPFYSSPLFWVVVLVLLILVIVLVFWLWHDGSTTQTNVAIERIPIPDGKYPSADAKTRPSAKIVQKPSHPALHQAVPARVRATKMADTASPLTTSSGPLTPLQIRAAYQGTTPLDGKGKKVAIIVAFNSPKLQSDLDLFNQRYGLPKKTLIIHSLGNQSNDGWAMEANLDTQYCPLMAPNAEIHVVQAASDSIQDLRQALIFANQTVKADIISQSWGIDESVVAQYNLQYLLEDQYLPGRQASGNPGSFYLAAAGDNSTLSYPASSPNNIAVGGTALDMNGLQRTGEQVWYDPGSSDGSSSSSSIGSGKGISTIFPRPAYQATVNDSPFRMTPDLSCVADTSNGQGVVIIHNGQAYGVAGTSVSCPTLAGMLATALSARRSPITQGLLMTKLYGGVVISSPLTPLQGLGRVNKRFIDSVVAM